MTTINEYLKSYRDYGDRVIPRLTCADGFNMSVQASSYHYCTPREDHAYLYYTVEIGYPSERVEELMPFVDGDGSDWETVYAGVPVEVVDALIEKHGGIA